MPDFIRRQLETPKGLGDILKEARKKKNISLDEAEEETKVRIKYLQALENGRYEALPATVYALGFLAKYADFLELDKEEVSAKFKQEAGRGRGISKLAPERRIKEPILTLTPRAMIISLIVAITLIAVGYVSYSLKQFTAAPNLFISSPSSEGGVIGEEQANIIGKTDEGVTLLINNQAVQVDDNGNFKETVKLSPGLNSFEIKAINQVKKETIKTVKVLADFKTDKVESQVSGEITKEEEVVTEEKEQQINTKPQQKKDN